MALTLSGDDGVAGVNGSATTPAVQGTDTNTGLSFGTDTVNVVTGGSTRATVDSSGHLLVGGSTAGNAATVTVSVGSPGATTGGLQLWSTTSGTSYVQFGDATGGATDHYRGAVGYEHNNDALIFFSAATERARITSTGDLRFNSGYGSVATAYGCRAWVNFDGTGTVSIRDSGNVSSITDNGTGDYTVNFTNSMPDDDFCVVGSAAVDGTSYKRVWTIKNGALATNLVRGQTGHSAVDSLENEDCLIVTVAVFR